MKIIIGITKSLLLILAALGLMAAAWALIVALPPWVVIATAIFVAIVALVAYIYVLVEGDGFDDEDYP